MREQYETKIMAAMVEMLKKASGHIEAEAHGSNIKISGHTTGGFQLMLMDCFIDDLIEDGLRFEDCLYMLALMRKIKKEHER